jgi:hypothetical protein
MGIKSDLSHYGINSDWSVCEQDTKEIWTKGGWCERHMEKSAQWEGS